MHNESMPCGLVVSTVTAGSLLLLQVYLVDYGLACRFRPEGRHREYKEDPRRQHDGTLEFTSIDAHKGVSEYVYRIVSNRSWIRI